MSDFVTPPASANETWRYRQDLCRTVNKALLGSGEHNVSLRATRLRIEDGTNASTLKISITNQYNGDTIAEQDNIGDTTSNTYFDYVEASDYVLIKEAAITGVLHGVIGGFINYNDSGTNLVVYAYASADGIIVRFYQAPDDAAIVLSTLVDTGAFTATVVYLTKEG